jgi:dTDP-4-amino-4,6-dideoxygalactose transaminase
MYGFYGIANKKLNEKLERELKEYFGAKHAFLVSSGKAALFLILSGLKRLTRKRKVIITAYTCFSVPSAIRMAGLEIVLCDIRPETLDFDFSQLRDLIDDDTMCVISTHLFGIPADVSKVRDLCENRKIFIIEDAAQAMGAVSGRGILGTFGDVAFFSLGRGKNITCGSGGIIITSEKDIADSIRKEYAGLEEVPMIEYIKNLVEIVFMMIFLRPELYWLPKILPFLKLGETRFYRTFPVRKLTGFQAGLLYDWRQKLETLNRSRSGNATRYIESFELSNGLLIYANGLPYNRFPIYLGGKASKDELCKLGNRIGISPMYPFPIHRIQEIQENLDHRDFEGAETISDTLVTLPTHILLNEKDKMMIRETVQKVLRHEKRDEHTFRQGVGCH